MKIDWVKPPQGSSGSAVIRINEKEISVGYRIEGSSIWINLESRWVGYDFSGSAGDDGLTRFDLNQRVGFDYAVGQLFDLTGGAIQASAFAGSGKKSSKVKSQMPGKVVKIQVELGQQVEANQPLLILEAMKMENEIRSSIAGKISEIRVQTGQAIETGTLLFIVDAAI